MREDLPDMDKTSPTGDINRCSRLLISKKAAVLQDWLRLIVDTYSPGTARFFSEEKDQFINPVGAAINQGMEAVYEEILGEMNAQRISQALDPLVRIRSVQDFPPAQAVACVFFLKSVIRRALKNEDGDPQISQELFTIYERIDEVGLLAFDLYMKCREKVFEITVNEIRVQREMALMLLERTNKSLRRTEVGQDFKVRSVESDE